MINSIQEAIGLLDNTPDLDHIVVEDWLFSKRGDSAKRGGEA
jgi:hypothetical protein